MKHIEDIVKNFFDKGVSDRDRAIFEAGISLGALFHQFTGIPLRKNKDAILNLEKTIQNSISTQPYINSVEVKININELKSNTNPYDYSVLNGENFSVKLVSQYGKIKIYSSLKYIEELKFPLMYIDKIDDENDK